VKKYLHEIANQQNFFDAIVVPSVSVRRSTSYIKKTKSFLLVVISNIFFYISAIFLRVKVSNRR